MVLAALAVADATTGDGCGNGEGGCSGGGRRVVVGGGDGDGCCFKLLVRLMSLAQRRPLVQHLRFLDVDSERVGEIDGHVRAHNSIRGWWNGTIWA